MDLRSKLLAECVHKAEGSQVVDIGALLERLLLFDVYVLDSVLLTEIPALVRAFGIDGTIRLLSSGALKIHLHPLTAGQVGQTDFGSQRGRRPLPLGSFSFGAVESADLRGYVSGCMADFGNIPGANIKDVIKLKSAVSNQLMSPSSDVKSEMMDGLETDLRRNSPVVKRAVLESIRLETGIVIAESAFSLRLDEIDDHAFRVTANLSSHGVSDEAAAHKLISNGLLAVAGLNQKIAQMRAYSLLCGFADGDLPLMESKLDFFWQDMSPSVQNKRLSRVLALANMPDLGAAAERGQINIDRLLEVRATRECMEFRQWLRTIDELDDNELRERIGSLSTRMGLAVQSNSGKLIRWATSTTVGLVPVLGSVLGATASLVDTFIVEKVLPVTGPLAFLGKQFPTVYK